MSNYSYRNQNPYKRQINDCVVRAISLAENKTWRQTFIELSELASKDGIYIDDSNFVEKYLDSKYEKICYKCKGIDYTIGEVAEKYNKGIYLITTQGHITCLIDGVIYDIWDCTSKNAWSVWKVDRGGTNAKH